MIKLTETQQKAANTYLMEKDQAEAGFQRVLHEAGVEDGRKINYNPITGLVEYMEPEPESDQ